MNPDLQAFIDIVWTNLGRLRSHDDVYRIYRRHQFVDHDGQNRKKFRDVLKSEMKNIEGFIIDMRDVSQVLAKTPGDDRIEGRMQMRGRAWHPTTEVLQPFESGYRVTEHLAEAFYHFVRDLPVVRIGPRPSIKYRLYIALQDGNYRRGANALADALLQALKEIDAIGGFHSFKAMGPYSVIVDGRRDHIVAYFSDQKSRETVTNRIIKMAQKDRELAAGPLPFCIERKAEGIGWADEPPGNTSYGIYLAKAIWKAAKGFVPDDKSPIARDTFHEVVLYQFENEYRIDPERPWAKIGDYQPPPQEDRPAAAIRSATHAATRAATKAVGPATTADRVR
ncbi:MAG: hypothetical protein WAK57_16170, partial [Desulfobacterales bacterium]